MTDPADFFAKAKESYDKWSAEMASLQAKMMEAGDANYAQMKAQIEKMAAQRKEVEAQIEKMGKANMDAFKDMQNGAEKAWKAMEKSFEDARKRYKD